VSVFTFVSSYTGTLALGSGKERGLSVIQNTLPSSGGKSKDTLLLGTVTDLFPWTHLVTTHPIGQAQSTSFSGGRQVHRFPNFQTPLELGIILFLP
jgi:hypothetical protein